MSALAAADAATFCRSFFLEGGLLCSFSLLHLHRLLGGLALIAFILGPLFEDNFRQAMLMSGGEMSILLRSPITWFFWIATILTLLALTGAWGRIASLLRKG